VIIVFVEKNKFLWQRQLTYSRNIYFLIYSSCHFLIDYTFLFINVVLLEIVMLEKNVKRVLVLDKKVLVGSLRRHVIFSHQSQILKTLKTIVR